MPPSYSSEDLAHLRDLDSGNPRIQADAASALLERGSELDALLSSEFPGILTWDPFKDNGSQVPFAKSSGLLHLISKRPETAVHLITPHLTSNDPSGRYFAVQFFHEFPQAELVPQLADRLFDAEPAIRSAASAALLQYRETPQFQILLQNLLSQLRVPELRIQLNVVQLFGQLKAEKAIPAILPFLQAESDAMKWGARSTLSTLAAQDFGPDYGRWRQWWLENQHTSRTEWLIQSLRHSNNSLQELSFHELKLEVPQELAAQLNHCTASNIRKLENWWNSL